MISYELAKKLKDAGFPQTGNGSYLEGNVEEDEGGVITTNSVYTPTLSELIEACGDRFYGLVRREHDYDKWSASTSTWTADAAIRHERYIKQDLFCSATGETKEEAVANLWLELNK